MDEELTVGRQLELPFMTTLKLKLVEEVNTYNESDLISMFEGADLAWMDLLFIDNWFEISNPKSDIVTEVMIFRDRETGQNFRAERKQDDPYMISNDIDRYEIEGHDFLSNEDTDDTDIMVELPQVKLEDRVWVYV